MNANTSSRILVALVATLALTGCNRNPNGGAAGLPGAPGAPGAPGVSGVPLAPTSVASTGGTTASTGPLAPTSSTTSTASTVTTSSGKAQLALVAGSSSDTVGLSGSDSSGTASASTATAAKPKLEAFLLSATWCGPCAGLKAGAWKTAQASYSKAITFTIVDIDSQTAVARSLGYNGGPVPMLVFRKNGKIVSELGFLGADGGKLNSSLSRLANSVS